MKRFIQTSTVVIGTVAKGGAPNDDFCRTRPTGFWPHLDYLVELDICAQTAILARKWSPCGLATLSGRATGSVWSRH